MQLNDAKHAGCIRELAVSNGHISDLELRWLHGRIAAGAKAGQVQDAWVQYLDEQFVSLAALQDMQFDWLGVQGMVGQLNDRWLQFWSMIASGQQANVWSPGTIEVAPLIVGEGALTIGSPLPPSTFAAWASTPVGGYRFRLRVTATLATGDLEVVGRDFPGSSLAGPVTLVDGVESELVFDVPMADTGFRLRTNTGFPAGAWQVELVSLGLTIFQ